MRRPGIVVVSGIVTEVLEEEICIKNDVLLPVSNKIEEVRCHLVVDPKAVQRLKLAPGAAVIASASDNFKIEMLFEGGEVPDRDFHLRAYTVRYNGSFDFECRGQEKERHVFVGNMMNAQTITHDGKCFSRATIGWKRKGVEEVRNLLCWPKTDSEKLEQYLNKRVVIVTGEPHTVGSATCYQAESVYTL
jgi:hypothetical protein